MDSPSPQLNSVLQPKLLDTNPSWISVAPVEHPTSNGCCNLAECKYEVHFDGTTCFTANCPHCRSPLLLEFQNGSCSVRSISLEGLNYEMKSGSELQIFQEHCPFCRELIAMRLEPQYYKTTLEKLFIYFVAMKSNGRLRIAPPEGSLGRLGLVQEPSISHQRTDQSTTLLSQLTKILEDSGCLSSTADGQPIVNLYWIRSCPLCGAATQIKFTPIPPEALRKETYTPGKRNDLTRFLLDRPGSKTLDYRLNCPSCEACLAVQLQPLKGSGYYMAKWTAETSNKMEKTALIHFGDSGAFFNDLSVSKSSTQPTSTATREAAREATRTKAREAADKDFWILTSLAPCVQYEEIKCRSEAHYRSFYAFESEQANRLAPCIEKGMSWQQRDQAYKDSNISAWMKCWLQFALRDSGHDVNYRSYPVDLSMERFVMMGWLFNKWQGNYSWKKLCPSTDCQSSIDVKFAPIPSVTAMAGEQDFSEEEKASRKEYMLRYHWDDTDDRHPSWIAKCPWCNVNIKAKLNRSAFASYEMVSWQVVNERDLQKELLESNVHLVQFGKSQTFFNHLTLTKSPVKVS